MTCINSHVIIALLINRFICWFYLFIYLCKPTFGHCYEKLKTLTRKCSPSVSSVSFVTWNSFCSKGRTAQYPVILVRSEIKVKAKRLYVSLTALILIRFFQKVIASTYVWMPLNMKTWSRTVSDFHCICCSLMLCTRLIWITNIVSVCMCHLACVLLNGYRIWLLNGSILGSLLSQSFSCLSLQTRSVTEVC